MRFILEYSVSFFKNSPHSSIFNPIPHASVRFRNYSVARLRLANEFSFARRKARILYANLRFATEFSSKTRGGFARTTKTRPVTIKLKTAKQFSSIDLGVGKQVLFDEFASLGRVLSHIKSQKFRHGL